MNPLLFPPTLIKRALEDLGAIADAARRLPALEEQVIERIDRIEGEALGRVDVVIAELEQVRDGIAPLDDDMRAVRDSVSGLEPLLRDVSGQLGALRSDLAPLGELADKLPGI
jgi:hypothetical protein